jgi:hypothetical protein
VNKLAFGRHFDIGRHIGKYYRSSSGHTGLDHPQDKIYQSNNNLEIE